MVSYKALNTTLAPSAPTRDGFNCTFMELKYVKAGENEKLAKF